MADERDHPWRPTSWAAAADAANSGLNGQGYVVHAAMSASQTATRFTWVVMGLIVVQVFLAAWQAWNCH